MGGIRLRNQQPDIIESIGTLPGLLNLEPIVEPELEQLDILRPGQGRIVMREGPSLAPEKDEISEVTPLLEPLEDKGPPQGFEFAEGEAISITDAAILPPNFEIAGDPIQIDRLPFRRPDTPGGAAGEIGNVLGREAPRVLSDLTLGVGVVGTSIAYTAAQAVQELIPEMTNQQGFSAKYHNDMARMIRRDSGLPVDFRAVAAEARRRQRNTRVNETRRRVQEAVEPFKQAAGRQTMALTETREQFMVDMETRFRASDDLRELTFAEDSMDILGFGPRGYSLSRTARLFGSKVAQPIPGVAATLIPFFGPVGKLSRTQKLFFGSLTGAHLESINVYEQALEQSGDPSVAIDIYSKSMMASTGLNYIGLDFLTSKLPISAKQSLIRNITIKSARRGARALPETITESVEELVQAGILGQSVGEALVAAVEVAPPTFVLSLLMPGGGLDARQETTAPTIVESTLENTVDNASQTPPAAPHGPKSVGTPTVDYQASIDALKILGQRSPAEVLSGETTGPVILEDTDGIHMNPIKREVERRLEGIGELDGMGDGLAAEIQDSRTPGELLERLEAVQRIAPDEVDFSDLSNRLRLAGVVPASTTAESVFSTTDAGNAVETRIDVQKQADLDPFQSAVDALEDLKGASNQQFKETFQNLIKNAGNYEELQAMLKSIEETVGTHRGQPAVDFTEAIDAIASAPAKVVNVDVREEAREINEPSGAQLEEEQIEHSQDVENSIQNEEQQLVQTATTDAAFQAVEDESTLQRLQNTANAKIPHSIPHDLPPEASPKEARSGEMVPRFPLSSINIDAERFQFKLDVEPSGGTRSLAGVQTFDPNLAGVVSVWRDPADGKVYVVNGHNRVLLARREDAETIAVMFLDAANSQEALAIGAQQNIAEGRGTALDAAKFFKEKDMNEEAVRSAGIPLTQNKAKQGLALAELNPGLFQQVINRELTVAQGAAIGEILANEPDLQNEMLNQLAEDPNMKPEEIRQLAIELKHAPLLEQQQDTLFGVENYVRPLQRETGKVASAIRGRMANDKTLFGAVTKNVERLEAAGSAIDVAESRKITETSADLLRIFDAVRTVPGNPINELIRDAAIKIGEGSNASQVIEETYDAVRKALPTAVSGRVESQREGNRPIPPAEPTGKRDIFGNPEAGAALNPIVALRELHKKYREGRSKRNNLRADGIIDELNGRVPVFGLSEREGPNLVAQKMRSPEFALRNSSIESQTHSASIIEAQLLIGKRNENNNVFIEDLQRSLSPQDQIKVRQAMGILREADPDMVASLVANQNPDVVRAAKEINTMFDRYRGEIKQYKLAMLALYQHNPFMVDGFNRINAGEDPNVVMLQINAQAQESGIKPLTNEDMIDVFEEFKAIDSWGIDNFVTNIEVGTLVAKDQDGTVRAVAPTRKILLEKMDALVKQDPSIDIFEIDRSYPGDEGIGLLVSPMLKKKLENAMTQAIEEEIEGISRDASRDATKAALKGKIKSGPRKSFAGPLTRRKDILEGEANIFDALPAYMYGIEKKMALDPVITQLQMDFPILSPNERAVLTRQAERAIGTYSYADQLLDQLAEGALNFAEARGVPIEDILGARKDPVSRFILQGNRATQAASHIRQAEAILKLGYRPVAGFINWVGGESHTWVKTGFEYMVKGTRFLKTEEGQRFIQEEEAIGSLGTSIVQEAQGEMAKSNLPFYHPLKLFSAPELSVRRRNLASNYVHAREEYGMSDAAARAHARKALRMQQFTYNAAAIPDILNGPIGQVTGQFKTYLLKEIEFMQSLNKTEALRYTAAMMMLAGPRGLIAMIRSIPILGPLLGPLFLDDLEKFFLTQAPGITGGIPAAILGMDISASAVPQLPKRPEDAAGPFLGDMWNLYKFVMQPMIEEERLPDELDAEVLLTNISPAMFYWEMLIDSVVDKDGWIVDENQNREYQMSGWWDRAALVAGAMPIDMKAQQKTLAILNREESRRRKQMENALNNAQKQFRETGTIDEATIDRIVLLGGPSARLTLQRVIRDAQLEPAQLQLERTPKVSKMDVMDALSDLKSSPEMIREFTRP